MAMTPERIKSMRCKAEDSRNSRWGMSTSLHDENDECLTEIERLQSSRTDSEILLEAANIVGRQPIQGALESESWLEGLAEELKQWN